MTHIYKSIKKVFRCILGDRIWKHLIAWRAYWVRKRFYARLIKKGDLCFDIGANYGMITRPLLQLGAKVVAVEPQEKCCQQLRLKFGDKIEIIQKGVAANEGVEEFHISNESELSSFAKDWMQGVQSTARFGETIWNASVKIETTTLDELIATYGIPAFIKIDVEGYELEVLKGLTHPVQMISFEYTVPEQTDRILQCIDEIKKNNPNIECNYSVGRAYTFAQSTWSSPEELKKQVCTNEFIEATDGNTAVKAGDIYIRTKANR